ncbi:DMT family transporter [Rhizobium sp. FY34]|uniref:DMT family transporter n=1 Tax=Rhizobium sp. FY34 TaxID=2562309 RepID=UPI0010C124DD|nr:DMT family transporter [Rhizobium sp. FY34]
MTPTVVALALTAAILHASWNAFLRSGADRLWSITVMGITGIIVALPIMLWLPWPTPTGFAFVLASAVLQVAYSVFLVFAYRLGDLSQVYPVVRGSVPLLVTLGGFLLTDQTIGETQMLGVALVAIGIMSLSLGKSRAPTTSILWALLTGLIIASYATLDSTGVRHFADPQAYAAWVLFTYGVLLILAYVVMRGRLVIDIRHFETWKALGGGIFVLIAYGVVIIAYSMGPAGPITAIRETSVVFAMLIGRLFLGEVLTPRRILACLVVAAGAILIGR